MLVIIEFKFFIYSKNKLNFVFPPFSPFFWKFCFIFASSHCFYEAEVHQTNKNMQKTFFHAFFAYSYFAMIMMRGLTQLFFGEDSSLLKKTWQFVNLRFDLTKHLAKFTNLCWKHFMIFGCYPCVTDLD